ncbi:conserved oligomeric Golgi complex subunit 6 [Platysternon megacephalum]|uniref:Conserved oligomeric Golgi complex subunit 6 n=1 Tax=Platysternon megacephalum TaxID=55544 RepID=A0A4D9EE15_9SAUR|nr:conserved oligomeric Golgi complex subunit 6 [Platysternon megacephalum]
MDLSGASPTQGQLWGKRQRGPSLLGCSAGQAQLRGAATPALFMHSGSNTPTSSPRTQPTEGRYQQDAEGRLVAGRPGQATGWECELEAQQTARRESGCPREPFTSRLVVLCPKSR